MIPNFCASIFSFKLHVLVIVEEWYCCRETDYVVLICCLSFVKSSLTHVREIFTLYIYLLKRTENIFSGGIKWERWPGSYLTLNRKPFAFDNSVRKLANCKNRLDHKAFLRSSCLPLYCSVKLRGNQLKWCHNNRDRNFTIL